MYHCLGCALYSFKGLLDDMLSGLGKNLNGHIIGDHILLDKSADKLILSIGGSGESNLYLLEAYIYQQFKEFQLLLQAHGIDESLISVAQVNTAPDRRLLYGILLYPIIGYHGRHMICLLVFLTKFLL